MSPLARLCCFLLILSPAAARASLVAINNLAPGTQGFAASLSGPLGEFFPGDSFGDRQIAFSFTTGADDVDLTEIGFVMNLATSPPFSAVQATLSTGSAVPGGVNPVVIGQVTPVPGIQGQLVTIAPSAPIRMLASLTYWVHITVPVGDSIYTVNNANAPVTAPGWALGNTWYYAPDDGWSEVTSGVQARARITVEPLVSSVPEPGAALLLGGLVLAGWRRRR